MSEELNSVRNKLSLEALEQERILGFISKLVDQCLLIGADQLEISNQDQKVNFRIRAKQEKILAVKELWWKPISDWLYSFCDKLQFGSEVLEARELSWRIGTGAILSAELRVRTCLSGKPIFLLTNFKSIDCETYLTREGVSTQLAALLVQASNSKSGAFLIGAQPSSLIKVLKGWQAISGSGAVFVVEQNLASQLAAYLFLADERPVYIVTESRELNDLVAILAEANLAQEQLSQFRALIVHDYLKRSCSLCSRKTTVSEELLSQLPVYLQSLPRDRYLVGRGCESCGETGYSGVFGVQSSLILNSELSINLVSYGNSSHLFELLIANNTQPLLEVGVRAAFSGATTLEAVFQIRKFVPDGFVKVDKIIQRQGLEYKSASQENSGVDSKLLESRKKTIMIVDDDNDHRSVLEMIFADLQASVIQASNGKQALELLANLKTPPDVIISDIMMPVMDGSEFVLKLKADIDLHRIPVLVLTALSDDEKEYALLDIGADDYCEKTVSHKVLVKRVMRLAEGR